MKISQIRTTPLSVPFKEPYIWAGWGRVAQGATVVLVEVETDEGIVGIGESTGNRSAEGVISFVQGMSYVFIGESPFDIEGLFAQAYRRGGFHPAPRFANLAFAGLEMALWDIIGKAVGRPVYQLLGGACRREVDYFAFLQGDTANQLAEDAKEAVAKGFSVIYMKIGRGEKTDLANVAAVRGVIGDRRLRLDANEAWDPLTAIYMINKLSLFNPEFIEQPTTSRSIAALKQVKDAVGVAIAADQCVYTANDVYEVCRQCAADVIVLSPHETGGLLAFKKAAAVAEAAGVSVCLHGQFVTSISDCAQHQMGMTLPNLTDGNQIMHQLLEDDIVAVPDLTPRNGRLGPISGSGLGFELDRDAVGRAAERYRKSGQYR